MGQDQSMDDTTTIPVARSMGEMVLNCAYQIINTKNNNILFNNLFGKLAAVNLVTSMIDVYSAKFICRPED